MKLRFVRDLDDWKDARLYKLSEPVSVDSYDSDNGLRFDHVIVSAVVAPYSGPETIIFPASENRVVDRSSWLPEGHSYSPRGNRRI